MLHDHEADVLRANGYEPHMEQAHQPESIVLQVLTQAEQTLEQTREAVLKERKAVDRPMFTPRKAASGMTREEFHTLVLSGPEQEHENER